MHTVMEMAAIYQVINIVSLAINTSNSACTEKNNLCNTDNKAERVYRKL